MHLSYFNWIILYKGVIEAIKVNKPAYQFEEQGRKQIEFTRQEMATPPPPPHREPPEPGGNVGQKL